MFHGWSWSLVLLFTVGSIGLNCTSKQLQVQEFPQNYSSYQATRVMDEKWLDMRVFMDTSLLLGDPDACTRAGQYVRVGQPSAESESTPACSHLVLNNCWKLCEERDVLTTRKAAYISDISELIVDWLQSVIKVKRVIGNILIPNNAVPSGCVDHLKLPDYYSKLGIPADLVLVVTGRPTMAHTAAWATECAADQSGRPVFGHINIGPGELDNFEAQKQRVYKVLLHEVTHVLGFNRYKFPFYTDTNGRPYSSVTKIQIIGGKQITKIITPGVVAAVQDHFGCSNIDGVPLEDGGDATTADSHWEKRIFRNEYMTGSSDQTGVVSKITLALLEDTGWYRADFYYAEHLEWGRGMGCNFVNGMCSMWEIKKGYFCGVPGAEGCTTDRSAMGYCNLIRHKSQLPARFQYFPDPNFGGSDELSDYCPYVAAYRNGICSDAGNQPLSPIFGERFGDNSKCFDSSLVKDGWTKRDLHPLCYEYRCEGSDDPKLEIQVGATWHPCPYSSSIKNITGFSGFLACPDASFCTKYSARKKRAHIAQSSGVSSSYLPLAFVFSISLLFY